ncbi:hypothetical protein SCHPADRAFT_924146 [Schizopora paradoxa]|uniref:PI31 proteasome regulator C-terminal domain-containing protein n=1 Tax=Schizopora paradoxa TaxID=27342 RepID=A0A0H2SRU5_9AGAM|nr:hypothetical protein SCHPADRAFT_924146 [Schizopora paradoxa]
MQKGNMQTAGNAAGNNNNAAANSTTPSGGNTCNAYYPHSIASTGTQNFTPGARLPGQAECSYYPINQQGSPTYSPQIGATDLNPNAMQSQTNSSNLSPYQGGGMIVGRDHPVFQGGQQGQSTWPGNGYLSPLAAPPGARFDPIVPFSGPSFGVGPGRRPPGSQYSGNPDFDELPPPGSGRGGGGSGPTF